MFKTYTHAELSSIANLGEHSVHYWQFIELELHCPWFYMELVRDYGDDIVGSMLMIPTVPILQQMLSELDDQSWFAQAHLVSPGHMRGGGNWMMEPLDEVSIAEDASGMIEGYIYKVVSGECYSINHAPLRDNLKVKEIVFSAARDLRVCD